MQTAQPLVSEPISFEVETGTENPKRYKSPGIDQIQVELIQARSNTLCSEILELIDSIWNKEELPQKWKESNMCQFIKRGDRTD
jgi:hypothetical protein